MVFTLPGDPPVFGVCWSIAKFVDPDTFEPIMVYRMRDLQGKLYAFEPGSPFVEQLDVFEFLLRCPSHELTNSFVPVKNRIMNKIEEERRKE